MTWISNQWKKLRDKKYREEFVATQARRAIPFQIRAMMKARGMSQQQLAERSGLTQGVIHERRIQPTESWPLTRSSEWLPDSTSPSLVCSSRLAS